MGDGQVTGVPVQVGDLAPGPSTLDGEDSRTVWRRYVPTSMALTILVGVALMPVVSWDWFAPLLAAIVIFPVAAAAAGVIWLLRRHTVARRVALGGVVLALSAVAGLVMLPPSNFGGLGVVICVPIGVLAALAGLAIDWLLRRVEWLGRVFVVAGSGLLAVCGVVSAIVYR